MTHLFTVIGLQAAAAGARAGAVGFLAGGLGVVAVMPRRRRWLRIARLE